MTQILTRKKWKIIKHVVGVVILQCTVLALGNFKIVYGFFNIRIFEHWIDNPGNEANNSPMGCVYQ
jgi:hypothetical protein